MKVSDQKVQTTSSAGTKLELLAFRLRARLRLTFQFVLTPFVFVGDMAIASVARLFRRKSYVRKHLVGDDPVRSSEKSAIFVHFDAQGLVHDYVVHQLGQLLDAGFRITFVSNAPIFPDASQILVRPFCKEIIWRYNTGYDFGAYKDGIASLGNLQPIETLVLMNDSVYGPFWGLGETLSAIDRKKYDFWGIVDSWERRRHHLQTFFVVFFAGALSSSAFKTFWRRYPYVNNKNWVIRNGEIRLSQFLTKHHLRLGVLIPFWSVVETMKHRLRVPATELGTRADQAFRARIQLTLLVGLPLNAMHFFWDVLITDYRCPFIKRELIKLNPACIQTIDQWETIISEYTPYDVSLIRAHLEERC